MIFFHVDKLSQSHDFELSTSHDAILWPSYMENEDAESEITLKL